MASTNVEVPLEHIYSSFVSQVHLKMDIDGYCINFDRAETCISGDFVCLF